MDVREKLVEQAISHFWYGVSHDIFSEPVTTYAKLAIEALEKQIPKKPTMGKYGHTECACCGWVVETFCGDLEQYPFCPNCGQAIDWEG